VASSWIRRKVHRPRIAVRATRRRRLSVGHFLRLHRRRPLIASGDLIRS
jgi:hypothetical protein